MVPDAVGLSMPWHFTIEKIGHLVGYEQITFSDAHVVKAIGALTNCSFFGGLLLYFCCFHRPDASLEVIDVRRQKQYVL